MIGRRVLATCAILLAAGIAAGADEAKPESTSPYAQWKNGPLKGRQLLSHRRLAARTPSMAPDTRRRASISTSVCGKGRPRPSSPS